ncbi:Seipin domain-containing protein [Cephalotus follicularis]|uniref:Seipin domain-containing protein n=1 Tax=Cephalotus follicularis TaxID=3775 RepID=A0A1Q3CK21_CEPFO|nr:Seipin domain-containing protein [Cephalotus follicularis]
MEAPSPTPNAEEDDHFVDAHDDFEFYDCIEADQSDDSNSLSAPLTEIPPPFTTLRRRSLSRRGISGDESTCSRLDSSITQVQDLKTSSRERKYKFYPYLKEKEKYLEGTESSRPLVDSVRVSSTVSRGHKNEESTVMTGDSVDPVYQSSGSVFSSFLVFVAGLLIKAIGFQFSLLISSIKFPVLVLYCSYMFIVDPFQAMKRGRDYITAKFLTVWNLLYENISPMLHDWLKQHESIWKLLLRFGWGLFWALYVGVILCFLLVFSVLVSGVFMRYLVEEPIQIKEVLNFDYTKDSPMAYVPILSCDSVECVVNCKEEIGVGKSIGSQAIPPNHNLQVAISLTLPESDYNRNLGVFQVRVDFLSATGKILASSRYPCMLQYKSEYIRLLSTFLKIAPLVTGYASESQTLNVKFRGFIEGVIPTSCLKVMIEKRAKFRPGAGIPEIYGLLLFQDQDPRMVRLAIMLQKAVSRVKFR